MWPTSTQIRCSFERSRNFGGNIISHCLFYAPKGRFAHVLPRRNEWHGRSNSSTLSSTAPISSKLRLNRQSLLAGFSVIPARYKVLVPSSSRYLPYSWSTKDCYSTATTAKVIHEIPSNPPPAIPLNLKLYQYSICPFCNRVKTVLDYVGSDIVSVQHIEVNPLTKSEIRPWKKVYKKVPIALMNDEEAIFGSDVIISKILEEPIIRSSLEQRWQVSSSKMTWDKFTSSEWIDFATNELAVWLYPNMCRTWNDSYRAFDYIHNKQLPYSTIQRFLVQNIGSLAMYFAANKIKKKHNVTDERQALDDVLVKLETALRALNPSTNNGTAYRFLSGLENPNLGDLSVYGVLRAIQDLPVYNEIITKRGGPILEWCSRMPNEIPNFSKQTTGPI